MFDELTLLRLLQLTDSALPIGTAAHSFGLESMIEDRIVTPRNFEQYLRDYMQESGSLDAVFCRSAHQLPKLDDPRFVKTWVRLNHEISARKYSRESREASLTLGRRFLRLAAELLGPPELGAFGAADSHHAAGFGLIARMIGMDERPSILAWLHQSAMMQISAAQRLMPLGQNTASAILWRLKPLLVDISQLDISQKDTTGDCFTPLPETAAMRHSKLTVRLFIS
jgi:urease accessory protein